LHRYVYPSLLHEAFLVEKMSRSRGLLDKETQDCAFLEWALLVSASAADHSLRKKNQNKGEIEGKRKEKNEVVREMYAPIRS